MDLYNKLVKRIALSSLEGINGFYFYYKLKKQERFLCMDKLEVVKLLL